MSGSDQERTSSNIVSIGASEADAVLANLRELRNEIVKAWRERAVILSPEERDALRAEIKQTCTFLEDLTQGS